MTKTQQNQKTRDITYLVDELSVQFTINAKENLIQLIDEAATSSGQSRSAFVVACINEHFNPPEPLEQTPQADYFRIEALQKTQFQLQGEIDFLRGEYSKINDALAQRLITEAKPRRHWWQFRRT